MENEKKEKKYKRVLIKLSGEAMGAETETIDFEKLNNVARMIAKVWHEGIEVALVIGAGNIWRGRHGLSLEMNAVAADHMGMLATVINALAMQDALERVDKDIEARVMTAVEMNRCAEPYNWRQAMHHLKRGRIVIFGYGTGDPLHSTDTASAQRAVEIEADAMFFAKNVDGIYTKDPNKYSDAVLIPDLTFDEAMRLESSGIDDTALAICKANPKSKLKEIRVFGLDDPENIMRVVAEENVGTTVHR